MNTLSKASLGSLTAFCLLAAATAQADVRIHPRDGGRIDIKGDEVVITADDDSRAEVDPAGGLKIRGKAVPVTDTQRQLLVQYSRNLRDMEQRGEAVDRQAWDMAPGILGSALADLFAGASDEQINEDANAAAKPLKDEVLGLCDAVEAERKVQDQISDTLPAFRPYAVIHQQDTEHNCHADDKDRA